jgi:tetratricopeptide (TPR) repeat protein
LSRRLRRPVAMRSVTRQVVSWLIILGLWMPVASARADAARSTPGNELRREGTVGLHTAGSQALAISFWKAQRSEAGGPVALVADSGTARTHQEEAQRLTSDAYRNLGRLQFQGAADKARRATVLDPTNAKAYAVLGNALLNLGDIPAGEQAIRQALALNSNLALAHVGLGTLAWNQASALESKQPPNPRDLAPIKEFYESAEKAFLRAIELEAAEPAAHNGLGSSLFRRNRLADAEKAFQKALELDPEYTAAHFNMGNVHLSRQQWPQAEAAYRRAIELYNQHASFHVLLAAALLGQGKQTEARKEADEARRLGLDSHWIYEELNRTR